MYSSSYVFDMNQSPFLLQPVRYSWERYSVENKIFCKGAVFHPVKTLAQADFLELKTLRGKI